MSEPKWWIEQWPTVPGFYVDHSPRKNLNITRLDGTPKAEPTKWSFYGPIPELPKDPPKLRRFNANFRGRRVAGVQLVGEPDPLGCHCFPENSNGTHSRMWCAQDELSEIIWLDKE